MLLLLKSQIFLRTQAKKRTRVLQYAFITLTHLKLLFYNLGSIIYRVDGENSPILFYCIKKASKLFTPATKKEMKQHDAASFLH